MGEDHQDWQAILSAKLRLFVKKDSITHDRGRILLEKLKINTALEAGLATGLEATLGLRGNGLPSYISGRLSLYVKKRFKRSKLLSSEFNHRRAREKFFDLWTPMNTNWSGDKGVFRYDSRNVDILKDGNGRKALVLSAQEPRQGETEFRTSFVRSRFTMTYGFVEILCRLGDSNVSSAFWLKEVKNLGGEKLEREIDVFEYAAAKKQPGQGSWVPDNGFFSLFKSNLRHRMYWKEGNDGLPVFGPDLPHEFESSDGRSLAYEDCLRVGILVMPDEISWFVNGSCVRTTKNVLFNSFTRDGKDRWYSWPRMHIQFDREVMAMHVERETKDGKESIKHPESMRIGDDLARDFRIYYCRTWTYGM